MSKATRVFIGLVCFVGCGICFGDTQLFIIPSHQATAIEKYEVDGVELVSPPDTIASSGSGGVGLACDPEIGLLFLTAEGSANILISDMITMQNINTKALPGATNLAGIVADVSKKRVYAIDRGTNHLYVLVWKYGSEYCFLYPEDYYVELENCGTAYGIALDEENGLLYVADNTTDVKYYSTADWSHDPNTDYITVSHDAISVAVDPNNQYLYTGFMYDSDNLSQYDLVQEEEITLDVGGLITGLTVDPKTSRIYLASISDYVEILTAFDPNGAPNLQDIGPSPTLHLTSPVGMVVINDDIYKSDGIGLWLEDGINTEEPNEPNYVTCIDAGTDFTYTITVDPNLVDHNNVTVTLYLPSEVRYEYIDMGTLAIDPNYNDSTHTYTWNIGTLLATDSPVVLTLDVTLRDYAKPGGTAIAGAVARSDIAINSATEETPICCWYTGGILYVDKDASGIGYGTSWANAFRDLQQALKATTEGCSGITQIWVAEGTYKPGDSSDKTFAIPDGVSVYGGFEGTETSITLRDYNENKTILDGYIGENEYGQDRSSKVVTMGDETLLDGFTVKNGVDGVSGSSSDFTVKNCIINDNVQYGIRCLNGDTTFSWCVIKNNGFDGVYCFGTSTILNLNNCKIYNNTRSGIYCYNTLPTIKNSILYQNGSLGEYYGIKLYNIPTGSLIRNCTIAHNINEGIKHNGTNNPDVRNCILAYNNDELRQLGSCSVSYSCVYDPNDPNTPTNNNINCNPGFAYDYGKYGYYHLATDSNCVDTGDPENTLYTGELDIDDENRVINNRVDRGADEYNCSDVSNSKDLNGDGIVNLIDFAPLAAAWLSYDPNNLPCNEPNCLDDRSPDNFDIRCDYQLDGSIDANDLQAFATEWLWEACWRNSSQPAEMMTMYGMSATSLESAVIEEQSPLSKLTDEELIKQAGSLANTFDFILKLVDEKEIKKKDAEELLEHLADLLIGLQDEYYLRAK